MSCSRRRRRSTTKSTKPCSCRNSELWKPSGRSAPIVSLITRGPAKPIRAPGSARLKSPSMANEAVTPPVVGLVMREMKGRPAASSLLSRALVFAICMRLRAPSIMRAPPLCEMMSRAACFSSARLMARAMISPTTDPIDPPMNAKSMAAVERRCPPTLPSAARAASFRPVFCLAASSRSTYRLRSVNSSGSVEYRFSSNSSNSPSS